jgi:hypothetical protein
MIGAVATLGGESAGVQTPTRGGSKMSETKSCAESVSIAALTYATSDGIGISSAPAGKGDEDPEPGEELDDEPDPPDDWSGTVCAVCVKRTSSARGGQT